MITIIGLIGYIILIINLGPQIFPRFCHGAKTPHLAITVWLLAIISVIITTIITVVFLAITAWTSFHQYRPILSKCAQQVQHSLIHLSHSPLSILLAILSVLGIILGFWLIIRFIRTLIRIRQQTIDHALQARLIGTTTSDTDVVLVDTPQPAAYAIAGNPSTIVLTRAAQEVLSDTQCQAVLAHERAHIQGHHAILMRFLKALASFKPPIRLITTAVNQVGLLLEMCADDVAVRRYGSDAVISGLLALCGIAPLHTLGAATTGVATRVERLMTTSKVLTRDYYIPGVMITLLVVGPFAIIVVSHALVHFLSVLFHCVC